MKFLLDTHALIWSAMDSKKLSASAKSAVLDPKNEIYVSVISIWEISIKYSTGRLELEGMIPDEFPEVSLRMGFSILEFSAETASSSHRLPKTLNNDPFDRIIAWEAIKSGMTLISCDKAFDGYTKYDLKRIW